MPMLEGYTVKYVDMTDHQMLIDRIDRAFGPEWWDDIIKGPMIGHDQSTHEELGRNIPLDDWEILLVAGSSQVGLNFIELRHLAGSWAQRHEIRNRYRALTERIDTGNRNQRVATAINFMLDSERKRFNVYTCSRG